MNLFALSLCSLLTIGPITTENALAAKRRAEAQLQQNQLNEAETIARKLIFAQPHSSSNLDLLGRIQIQEKDFAAARETYQKATQLNPNDPALWANLALVSRTLLDWQGAHAALLQATKLAPTNASLWCELSQSHLAQNQADQALTTAKHALSLDPKNPLAFLAAASAEIRLNRIGDAETSLREALLLAPNQPNCLTVLANLQIAQKQTDAAIGTLRRLTSRHPDESYPQLLQLARLLHEKAKATQPLDKALALEAFNALQTMLPLCPADSNDHATALALRDELRKILPP